jgi:D-glycero-beta-D-manno-heptose-7-phosphate kinase
MNNEFIAGPVPVDLTETALTEALGRFGQAKVLVVGDIAIDEMIYGQVDRLSREAPVVILRHHRTEVILGAAGNAAHNLAALGAQVTVAGVLGDDFFAHSLRDALARDGVTADGMMVDASRPTTTKTRISGMVNASITQQVVRLDRESREPLSPALEDQLVIWLEANAARFDALLLSDYGLGVVTPRIIATCRALVAQHGLRWAVDSQQDLAHFAGADVMTPNQPEAEKNLGLPLDTDEQVLRDGPTLLAQCGGRNLLVTRGHAGMALFAGDDGSVSLIPAFNKSEVFDVTGAGDTVVATLLLAYTTGSSMVQAAVLGNLAASLVVKHFGAATTSVPELTEALHRLAPDVLPSVRVMVPV